MHLDHVTALLLFLFFQQSCVEPLLYFSVGDIVVVSKSSKSISDIPDFVESLAEEMYNENFEKIFEVTHPTVQSITHERGERSLTK